MKKYNKLVRDKIPDLIKKDGKGCEFQVVDHDEYKQRLYAKMGEELNEFIENPSCEEAADIWEVFLSLCRSHNLDIAEVTKVALFKAVKKGSFRDRIVLMSVEDDN